MTSASRDLDLQPSAAGWRHRSTAPAQMVAQFADGFGGKFNALILALYALRVGGLAAFSGLLAVGMIGSVLSAVVSGYGVSRLGASRTMKLSAVLLAIARFASYLVVFMGGSATPILASRFVGSVAAGVVMAGAKAQTAGGERAAASLAWLSVANGGGQAAGAVVAGVMAATASVTTLGVVGLLVGVGAIVPMYRIASRSTGTAVSVRRQFIGHRAAAPLVALAAIVNFVAMGLASMSDALVVLLHSQSLLGPAAAAAFSGSFLAAWVLRRYPRFVRLDPRLAWPALGVIALIGWEVAGVGWPALLLTMVAAGFAGQMLASTVEYHVMNRVDEAQRASSLAATSAVGSLASAAGLLVVPRLISSLGVEATAAILLGATVTVAAVGGAMRRRGMIAPA